MKVNFDLGTLITTDHYNQYITYEGSLSKCMDCRISLAFNQLGF